MQHSASMHALISFTRKSHAGADPEEAGFLGLQTPHPPNGQSYNILAIHSSVESSSLSLAGQGAHVQFKTMRQPGNSLAVESARGSQ